MIAKLAKTCTLRISPDKLNFVLSDKVANGGVSMWCELEQVSGGSERPANRPHPRRPRMPPERAQMPPHFSSLRRTSSANFKWKVSPQKTMRFI